MLQSQTVTNIHKIVETCALTKVIMIAAAIIYVSVVLEIS